MGSHRHLLGTEGLSAEDALLLLDRAERWFALSREPVKKDQALRGKTVVNLFFEASTRTRTSFEIAGKRLGADVVNISASSSSATKGETLVDTARNVEAMSTDVVVVRHAASGAAALLAERLDCAVVNAGDGWHEHPTQALLDAFTIRRAKGRVAGLTVAICGDILHSRVARSNAHLLTTLGATVRLSGPLTLLPRHAPLPGVSMTSDFAEALRGADVVMMLRIQRERLSGSRVPSTREYSRTFGLNGKALGLARPDAVIMHPGPINRGVELDTILADSERSLILDQVESGVAVRMAVLEALAGSA